MGWVLRRVPRRRRPRWPRRQRALHRVRHRTPHRVPLPHRQRRRPRFRPRGPGQRLRRRSRRQAHHRPAQRPQAAAPRLPVRPHRRAARLPRSPQPQRARRRAVGTMTGRRSRESWTRTGCDAPDASGGCRPWGHRGMAFESRGDPQRGQVPVSTGWVPQAQACASHPLRQRGRAISPVRRSIRFRRTHPWGSAPRRRRCGRARPGRRTPGRTVHSRRWSPDAVR